MKTRNKLYRFAALLLAVIMMMSMLAGCGKNDAGDTSEPPTESESQEPGENGESGESGNGEYSPEDLSAAGGFSDGEEETKPVESETPEEPENQEHPGTYGGIPVRNIITFMVWFSEQDGVTISEDADPEEAAKLIAEMKELDSKTDEEIADWFDKNVIQADDSDYSKFTQEEIDDARNMTIVLMAAMMEYIPKQVPTEEFLGPEGMKILERWSAKMTEQTGQEVVIPGVDETGDNTGTGDEDQNSGGQGDANDGQNNGKGNSGGTSMITADYGSINVKSGGDRPSIQFTASVPSLAGTGSYPQIVILVYNDDGMVETECTCSQARATSATNKDTGVFVYDLPLRTKYSADELSGRIYARYIADGEVVEDFYAIPKSDCTFIY